MKTTLYLTSSADGYIASSDHSVPWGSEAWDTFISFCAQYKNVIVGAKSYELMHAANDLEKFNVSRCIVVSKKLTSVPEPEALIVRDPRAAIEVLQKEGFELALLSGGRALAQSFLEQRLVDELVLDIQPVILGQGIKMPSLTESLLKLELIESRKSGAGSVLMRYGVSY